MKRVSLRAASFCFVFVLLFCFLSKGEAFAAGNSSNRITVSFRLIGAEQAKQDVDLGINDYLPAYVTWIASGAFELSEGSSVYDLWVKATGEAGVRSVGADRNYVKTVYAPDAQGGYALSEFTNGPRSGWMYTINGKHPGFGLKEQTLRNGDVVIWHYVSDYSYEVSDWYSGSIGDGSCFDLWMNAPDYLGGVSVSITSVKASKTKASVGEKITWTSTATGGSGTLQYGFRIYKDGALVKKSSYGTAATYSYTPEEAGTYKVKVYVKDAAGTVVTKKSRSIAITASTVPVLTGATAAAGKITVKWNAVNGATKYAVYRKAAGETSWTRLTKTFTGTTYTDKSADLVAGTNYSYTVRAYVDNAWSGYNKTGVSVKVK